MVRPRGLNNRLCSSCGKVAPHRTLYAKMESGGKSKWLRLFWACTACNEFNHVLLPTYKLAAIPIELPSPFVRSIVDALEGGLLNFDELILRLRKHCAGVRHVFNPDVTLALEYLKRQGIVTEQVEDLTEQHLAELRARRWESKHLGPCPAEMDQGVVRKSLVSLYSYCWPKEKDGGQARPAVHRLYASFGVLCVHCLYHRIDVGLATRQ